MHIHVPFPWHKYPRSKLSQSLGKSLSPALVLQHFADCSISTNFEHICQNMLVVILWGNFVVMEMGLNEPHGLQTRVLTSVENLSYTYYTYYQRYLLIHVRDLLKACLQEYGGPSPSHGLVFLFESCLRILQVIFLNILIVLYLKYFLL